MTGVETFFEGIPWQITGWGAFMLLTFLNIRAIIRGDLVPGVRHEEARSDLSELKKDYREQGQLLNTVLEQGVTTVALLRSIRRYAAGGGGLDDAEQDDRADRSSTDF